MNVNNTHKEIVYSFPFCFFLIEYVFGMYFNDIFPSIFSSSDEILALVLLGWSIKYMIQYKGTFFNKEIRIFIGIVLFYLCYSFYIKSNVPIAILADFLIQLKPFIAYFMISYLGFTMNKKQKEIVKNISLFLFAIGFIVVFVGVLSGALTHALQYVYGHPTRYGTALLLVGLTYLFCSGLAKKKDIIMVVIILTFSLFSTRSKIYGFYAIAMSVILMLRGNIELKISLKNAVLFGLLALIAIFVAYEKILFYFLDFDVEDEYSLARPALYVTSWSILWDYFPFGSGLASFASHYSGAFYSHIYPDYDLDRIWGLLESDPAFVADTGYPGIAQLGVVGLILYVVFFTRIIRKCNRYKKEGANSTFYLISILLVIMLIIENVGDAAFTSNRGFYIMVLLALSINASRESIRRGSPYKTSNNKP